MVDKLRSLGLCLGASTVSIVHVEQEGRSGQNHSTANPLQKPRIIEYSLHTHEGDPKRTLLMAFEQLDLNTFDRITATGRKFRHFVNLTSIAEPQAVEYYGQQHPVEVLQGELVVVAAHGLDPFLEEVVHRRGLGLRLREPRLDGREPGAVRGDEAALRVGGDAHRPRTLPAVSRIVPRRPSSLRIAGWYYGPVQLYSG